MRKFYELDEFEQGYLTNNKSAEKIIFLYDVFHESARRFFARLLGGHDENNPYHECFPLYEYEQGCSDIQIPCVEKMFMDQVEGVIYIKFDYETEYVEFDDIPVEALLTIISHFQ